MTEDSMELALEVFDVMEGLLKRSRIRLKLSEDRLERVTRAINVNKEQSYRDAINDALYWIKNGSLEDCAAIIEKLQKALE